MKSFVQKAGQLLAGNRFAALALMGSAAALSPSAVKAEEAAPATAAAPAGPVIRVAQCTNADDVRRDIAQVRVQMFKSLQDAQDAQPVMEDRGCKFKYLDAATGQEQTIVFEGSVNFKPEYDRQTERSPSRFGFRTDNATVWTKGVGLASNMSVEANYTPPKVFGDRIFLSGRGDMINGRIGLSGGAGVTPVRGVSVQGGVTSTYLGNDGQTAQIIGAERLRGVYAQADLSRKFGKVNVGAQVRHIRDGRAQQTSAYIGTNYGPATLRVNYTTGSADQWQGRSTTTLKYNSVSGGAYMKLGTALGMDLSVGPEYRADRATYVDRTTLSQRLNSVGAGVLLADKSGSTYRLFSHFQKATDMRGNRDNRVLIGLSIGGAAATNPRVATGPAFNEQTTLDAQSIQEQASLRRGMVIVEDGQPTQVASLDQARTAYALPQGTQGPVLPKQASYIAPRAKPGMN